MVLTTGDRVDGYSVTRYISLVSTEAVMGIDVVREMVGKITDVMGGRAKGYEREIRTGKSLVVKDLIKIAEEMRADAVIGVRFDVDYLGGGGGPAMMMVSVFGTAVTLGPQTPVPVIAAAGGAETGP